MIMLQFKVYGEASDPLVEYQESVGRMSHMPLLGGRSLVQASAQSWVLSCSNRVEGESKNITESNIKTLREKIPSKEIL